MRPLDVLNQDPSARQLLASRIPARLAYTALDGTPRVIPIAYHFDGERFVMATVERAPKVTALAAHPHVALTIDTDTQPPVILQVRGTAAVTIVDGVVPEYLVANRKLIPVEQWDAFEAQALALYDRMARIEITPTWATVFDFETRAPRAMTELAEAKGLAGTQPHPAPQAR